MIWSAERSAVHSSTWRWISADDGSSSPNQVRAASWFQKLGWSGERDVMEKSTPSLSTCSGIIPMTCSQADWHVVKSAVSSSRRAVPYLASYPAAYATAAACSVAKLPRWQGGSFPIDLATAYESSFCSS